MQQCTLPGLVSNKALHLDGLKENRNTYSHNHAIRIEALHNSKNVCPRIVSVWSAQCQNTCTIWRNQLKKNRFEQSGEHFLQGWTLRRRGPTNAGKSTLRMWFRIKQFPAKLAKNGFLGGNGGEIKFERSLWSQFWFSALGVTIFAENAEKILCCNSRSDVSALNVPLCWRPNLIARRRTLAKSENVAQDVKTGSGGTKIKWTGLLSGKNTQSPTHRITHTHT